MSIVSNTGKTRFRAALERAAEGGAPCVGQWIEFPGFTLARTIAGLGEDVGPACPSSYRLPASTVGTMIHSRLTMCPHLLVGSD